jgi:hypothetical protein
MNDIPTAELLAMQMRDSLGYNDLINPVNFASLVAIEFAKLHVEAQIETIKQSDGFKYASFKEQDSISNAYPLDNIK